MLALASISGFLTVGYMLTIPTDPTDNFVFGFSAKRTAILAFIVGASFGFLFLVLKTLIRRNWALEVSTALSAIFSKIQYRLITFFVLNIALVVDFFILTKPMYDETFLDEFGILYSRLAPPLVWAGLITFFSILALSLIGIENNGSRKTGSARIEFLDISRGFAILLAISIHIFLWTDALDILGGFKLAILSITRTGTPTFIILTGIMVELVYLRIAQSTNLRTAAARLVGRSLMCYLGGLGSMIILEIRYGTTLRELLDYVLMRKTFGYSSILQVYIFILLLIIPILWLRMKTGPYLAPFSLIGLWVFTPIFDHLTWPAETSNWSAVLSILTGHPHGLSSFSAFHLLSLLGVGMILGRLLQNGFPGNHYRLFSRTIAWMIIALGVVIIGFGFKIGFLNFLSGYTGSYRVEHHPGYYLAGTFGSLVFIQIFFLARSSRLVNWIKQPFLILGRDSLWAFAVGNSIIFLWPIIRIDNLLEMAGVWLAHWMVILFILNQKRFLLSWIRKPVGN